MRRPPRSPSRTRAKAISRFARLLPRLVAALAFVFAAALLLAPPPEGWSEPVLEGAALLIFAVTFWATGVIPTHLTAIAFFLIAMVFAVVPASTVFSGFGSTAVWLVFGGLVIGVAVERTGLGGRFAERLVGLFRGSYFRVIAGVVTVGTVLAFFMPSTMGRVVLLIPIIGALADRMGFAPGSPGRNGMIMATALGTFMPAAAILPSNVANMVLAGSSETLYGLPMRYGAYLELHFPVLGLLKCVLIVLLAWVLYPDRPNAVAPAPASGPMSRDQKLLAAVLAIALALWATDFLHGVSPAWIALGAGLFCLLPGIGLVPARSFDRDLNFSSLFYVAGVLGLAAVVESTGLGEVLGHALRDIVGLHPGEDAHNFGALSGIAAVLSMATTMGGVPAVLTPLSDGFAEATGLPLITVLMTQVVGFSTVLLPYQLAPLMVAMQLGGVRLATGARLTLALALVTILVLIPINYFWWRWLGYFETTVPGLPA